LWLAWHAIGVHGKSFRRT